MRRRRIILIAGIVCCGFFALYLGYLYRRLDQNFGQQEEFIPTQIYSDVSRITPPQTRSQVEARLKSLGYAYKSVANEITFDLHPINYPTYLIPDNHPLLDSPVKNVVLEFDGPSGDASALLQSIQLGPNELQDLYLEPELVATLSRGSQSIRSLVKFEEIPASIWKAIIAIEDQHFLEHNGLDPRGIARAIWVNLRRRSWAQGGSTLTQQLVKNLMARRTKNIFRKFNELFLAVLLEVKYSKEEILERYLNEVYLGQVGSLEIHGVAEGAQHFFGKRLADLNLAETALIAGLIRGPYYYSPYRYKERALERERLVLRKMVETGQIAPQEEKAALKLPIRLAPPQSSANKAPFFTDFVKAELIRQLKDKLTEQEITAEGLKVYTTLDMTMNAIAQLKVAQGIEGLEARMKKTANQDHLEGALAAVDQSTGFIRVLIGGKNYGQSNFNRILNMKRQVGSTFKPVVYLSAFLKGVDPHGVPYGPGHPVEDSPWSLVYDHGRQTWSPKNYEKEYMGWITYRSALAHSINTAAAKLGAEIGTDSIIKTARALGIESDLPAVPSLALGVAELSPVELLRAYATIANHGMQDEFTAIRGLTKDDKEFMHFAGRQSVSFEPGPVDLLTDMLQNVFLEGTAKDAVKMGFDRPAAGKTGTTSNHRDSWFAGFTPQLTCVVWVGMDQDVPKSEDTEEPPKKGKKEKKEKVILTGATTALPIWAGFMKEALIGDPPTTFSVNANITAVRIDRHTGKLAESSCPDEQTTQEKYVTGNEPRESSCEPYWPETQTQTVEQ